MCLVWLDKEEKGGWSSRLHIAQRECLGHAKQGLHLSRGMFVWILGDCMRLSWGYKSSLKISAKGAQEWGFYKTQQVTY